MKSLQISRTEEIAEELRKGNMVIIMDDEDRENEGDLIMAAEHVTPEAINFMATHARGLICLTLTEEHATRLGLQLMERENTSPYATHFSVSIEAASGVTTGISAADRAHTIKVAVRTGATSEDLVRPGHVFPVIERPGGVLNRAGHTEAGCELTRMAGLVPSAVIVEIMNEDGTMARLADLEVFAQHHGLKLGSIADLIQYRLANDRTVELDGEGQVQTAYGEFNLCVFRDLITGDTHTAMVLGDVCGDEPVLVRVMQRDTLNDVLAVKKRGRWSAAESMQAIAQEGRGVLVLLGGQEPADQVVRSLSASQDEPSNNPEPEHIYRTIGAGSQILRHLGVRKMNLLSKPVRFTSISGFDLEVSGFQEKPDQ